MFNTIRHFLCILISITVTSLGPSLGLHVSLTPTVPRTFTVAHVLWIIFKYLIYWLERETLSLTLALNNTLLAKTNVFNVFRQKYRYYAVVTMRSLTSQYNTCFQIYWNDISRIHLFCTIFCDQVFTRTENNSVPWSEISHWPIFRISFGCIKSLSSRRSS